MREILYQSVRNLFFHVPMWFAMITVFSLSCFFSLLYLRTNNLDNDIKAQASALTGIIFGIAGLATGSQWARATWGTWWTPDVKLNGAAITMLMYLAYTVLRGNFEDRNRRARVSAVYNIFSYAIMIPLIMILPRLQDSLHPGNGGNPGFKTYDLDGNLRLVFYPAAIGWVILSLWISQLTYRVQKLRWQTD
jgi:heme exporter protein C